MRNNMKYLTRDDGSAGGVVMGWYGAAPTLHHGMWDHWPVAGRFLSKHEGIEGMEAAVQFFGLVISHGEIREVVQDNHGLRLK